MTVECALLLPIFLFSMLAFFAFFGLLSKQENVRHTFYDAATAMSVAVTGNESARDADIHLEQPVYEKTPFSYPVLHLVQAKAQVRTRKWTGGYLGDGGNGTDRKNYVFRTEYGEVFHTDPECSFLHPTVRRVGKTDVYKERNYKGEIYYPCESCGGDGSRCYITEYGESYHSDPNCPALKRTIYMVEEEAIEGCPLCSKCASHMQSH